ncbi:MAG: hypothetical protein NVSMB19_03110 [Vulcanimicrobiaceae bacterium]
MTVRGLRSLLRAETALLALASALLIAVGIAGRSANDRPASLDSYSTYDAASGGYRAFYELLGRAGLHAERFERRPAFLDAGIATLVYVEPLGGDPRALTPTRADIAALETWVRGGGSLLYVGYDDAAAAAGILHLPRLARGAAARAGRNGVVAPELRAAGISRIVASAAPRFADAPRGRTRVLLGDRRGALVVTYAYGRGTVVAAVDRAVFTNARIATGDAARLAVELARPRRSGGVVAFDEMPHGYAVPERWWSIVPRPFAIALGIAGAALLVALAGAALRLGPPLVPAARDDRSTAEFLDAVATLFERRGERRGTLADAAASASHALARAHGLEATASNERIAARIERADLRASFLTLQRLATEGAADPASFVRGVALAQQLRKESTLHGRSRN